MVKGNTIVWIEDPRKWEYLRESTIFCGKRRGLPPGSGNIWRLVGYEELAPSAKSMSTTSRIFQRRVWWLKNYDRGCPDELEGYRKLAMPCEAVLTKDLIARLGGREKADE